MNKHPLIEWDRKLVAVTIAPHLGKPNQRWVGWLSTNHHNPDCLYLCQATTGRFRMGFKTLENAHVVGVEPMGLVPAPLPDMEYSL